MLTAWINAALRKENEAMGDKSKKDDDDTRMFATALVIALVITGAATLLKIWGGGWMAVGIYAIGFVFFLLGIVVLAEPLAKVVRSWRKPDGDPDTATDAKEA